MATERVMTEQWRAVTGYEGAYQVSDNGRVRSVERDCSHHRGGVSRLAGRMLAQRVAGSGYPTVWLSQGGVTCAYSTHRLVALAFLGADSARPEVNHIDGDKTNNQLANLEWVTRSRNVAHSYEIHGSRKVS